MGNLTLKLLKSGIFDSGPQLRNVGLPQIYKAKQVITSGKTIKLQKNRQQPHKGGHCQRSP